MSVPFDLLKKNELRVTDVVLDCADLSGLAGVVADVLVVGADEVLVTDYLDQVLTFDVLRPTIYPHQLLGRRDELLRRLGEQPGVRLSGRSRVTADGMLGWIAAAGADAGTVGAAMAGAERRAAGLDARIARRVRVFSTGAELASGEVKDTNRAVIQDRLTAAGFLPEHGGTLRDDAELIGGSIRRAAEFGFGVVITTGGVGAESKDRTVEGLLSLVPDASTPYTAYFEPGHGRHTKNGIRIGVGTFRGCRVICLPGPNDEVRACLDVLVPGLITRQPDSELADTIANTLRDTLRERMNQHGGPA